MVAYVIAGIEVTNREDYRTYAEQTVASAKKVGGRFLAKGGPQVVIEGPAPDRHVIIEFPSREVAETWYKSDEYQAILPIALRSSNRTVVIVEGYE